MRSALLVPSSRSPRLVPLRVTAYAGTTRSSANRTVSVRMARRGYAAAVSTHPGWLKPLLRRDPPEFDEDGAGRFEGLYGGVYDRVIQSDLIRRFAPLAYGDAGPLPDLDGFAARVADAVPEGGVLLDVPSGGGTL